MIKNIDEALGDIRTVFEQLLGRLQARVALFNGDEMVIISQRVVLWLPVDHDGLELWFIRRRFKGDFEAYRLESFLVHRANRSGNTIAVDLPRPTNQRERIIVGATWSVQALEAYGQDVLAGDQSWVQEFEMIGGKGMPLPPALARELAQVLVA